MQSSRQSSIARAKYESCHLAVGNTIHVAWISPPTSCVGAKLIGRSVESQHCDLLPRVRCQKFAAC